MGLTQGWAKDIRDSLTELAQKSCGGDRGTDVALWRGYQRHISPHGMRTRKHGPGSAVLPGSEGTRGPGDGLPVPQGHWPDLKAVGRSLRLFQCGCLLNSAPSLCSGFTASKAALWSRFGLTELSYRKMCSLPGGYCSLLGSNAPQFKRKIF